MENDLIIETEEKEKKCEILKEKIEKMSNEFIKKIESLEKENNDLKNNKYALEERLKKNRENFSIYKQNIINRLNFVPKLKENYKKLSENTIILISSFQKEHKSIQMNIQKQINDFLSSNKNNFKIIESKNDSLMKFIDNFKKDHEKEFKNLLIEKNELLKVNQLISKNIFNKEEMFQKEKNIYLHDINTKNNEIESLKKEIYQIQNLHENLKKDFENEKEIWFSEKNNLFYENTIKDEKIYTLTNEINNMKGKSIHYFELSENIRKELDYEKGKCFKSQEEIKNLNEKIEKFLITIKNQEKTLTLKENVIMNLELELEFYKKELVEMRKSTKNDLTNLESLKQKSTPHWNNEKSVNEVHEEKWG